MGKGRRRRALGVLGWAALALFLLAALLVVAALAFSVTVSGHSMEPTVREGDRLLVDPFAGAPERFDVVESNLGEREIPVVKRVVGLPGDRLQVRWDEAGPQVLVRPAGEQTTYVVDNPVWVGRAVQRTEPCCADDGTSLAKGDRPRWVTVPDDHYWLVGDNWDGSDDSRTFGFVAADGLRAVVVLRLHPFGRFGPLPSDARLVGIYVRQSVARMPVPGPGAGTTLRALGERLGPAWGGPDRRTGVHGWTQ